MTLTPEQNRAICEWAGIKADKASCDAFHCPGDCSTCQSYYPDLNTDRLAVCDLLDVLRKRYLIDISANKFGFSISINMANGFETFTPNDFYITFEAAILAAVLQVMEKEPKLL